MKPSLAPVSLLTFVVIITGVALALNSGAPAWVYLLLWASAAPVCFTAWFTALEIGNRIHFRRQVRSLAAAE